jgi:hypothetical protein
MIKYLEWLRSICPVVMSADSIMYARVWRGVHVPAACEPIETWGLTCSTHNSFGVSSDVMYVGSSVQPVVSDGALGVCNSADTLYRLWWQCGAGCQGDIPKAAASHGAEAARPAYEQ